jgi:hypothetical protein
MMQSPVSCPPTTKSVFFRRPLGCRGMALVLLTGISAAFAGDSYDLAFSTYFGGTNWEHARDVCADAQGNVYVCGGTASRDFPVTPGVYDETFNFGDTSGDECDAFVCKFGPDGRLLWSTYLGGPGYDRAYGIEVDAQGYVYVAGRAGRGFPTTPTAFQPTFQGYNGGGYGGYQNAFVAKLSPDGSQLVWASYVGVAQLCRDIAIDAAGDIYLPLGYPDKGTLPPDDWFANAFQKKPQGATDCGAIKVSGDGSKVLWATWLGGSGDDQEAASIRVGRDGRVYVGGSTFSTDFPTTPGAHDSTYNGAADFFVACLTPDGSGLVYGTYLGGDGNEWISTHNLAIDDAGNAYVAVPTASSNYPVTRGAFQRTHAGGGTDWAVSKLSPTGALLASTLIGGSGSENADGVYVDAQGNVFITGETQSTDFPVTSDAWQKQSGGGSEAALVVLAADFSQLLHATYLGGSANDNGRSGFLGSDGSLYVVGASDGSGWPAQNAYQSAFGGGGGGYGNGDCILAKFAPASTISLDPSRTYQTISGWEAVAFALEPSNPAFEKCKDTLFDQAVNDLGFNRVRLEIRSGVENTNDNWSDYQAGTIDYQTWRSRRYATINDNADPCTIDWSGYHFSEMDSTIDRIVNPLRDVLAAKGEKLIVNVNYVAFTGQITDGIYIHNDPAEYAEFVLATYLHLQQKYGWVPDLWEVILEPDNVSQWNGKLLGQAIAATAQRLREAGFEPAFVAPSNTNMGNAVQYFDQMIQVPGVLPVLREFSYHRYGGVSPANLQAIAARARQYGIGTAMLEWWSTSNGYRTLHEDLKAGNNSAWEQGVLGGALNSQMSLYEIDDSNPASPRVLLPTATKFLRQYYKFVRPGAVRIEAASQLSAFDPLAFINADGGCVVVVKCEAGGAFSVGRLPAGTYGLKYTTASEFDVDLPDQTIGAGQALVAAIPQAGALTIYAKLVRPDDEAPSTPKEVRATDASRFRIALTWNASTDNVAVAGYRIYRDGVEIGSSAATSFEDPSIAPAVSYTYEVSAYDLAGNESPLSAPLVVMAPESNLDSQLLGYWKFDEGLGELALDSSGYGHTGTIIGAQWVTGKTGQALSFDGIDDYVQIPPAMLLDNLEAVTMMAWVRPRVDAHWHVLDKGDGDKRLYAEGISRTLDGRIRYSGTHAYSKSVNETILLDMWQHVAMVWSRTTNVTRLYHNGAEVRYSQQDTGTGEPLDDRIYPFVIGARGALGEVTFFNGPMDEVRLYKRALTAPEIRAICGPAPSARSR